MHAEQNKHGTVAPGQLDPTELECVYNYRHIDKNSTLFAIIGNPVGHSKSPHFHNHIFRTQHINACYVPIQCESVESFYHFTKLVPIAGFSITLPHKEQVIKYLDYIDMPVKMIGACNTVVVQNGKWRGYNTDLHGFDFPLHKMHILPTQNSHATQNRATPPSTQSAHHLNQRRALIIGAGGVARTACFSLLHHGYHICIVNRSSTRLHTLINQISTHYDRTRIASFPLSKSHLSHISAYTQLIIQTTSVGMHPHTTQDPLSFYPFRGNETVYDLVYNPEYTTLLRRAENAGCTVISGMEMFRAQADAQSAHFVRSAHS